MSRPDQLISLAADIQRIAMELKAEASLKVPAVPVPLPTGPATYTVKGFTHEYSTMDPWNLAHTAMILQKPGGEVWLFDANGGGGWKLPVPIVHGSQCRWSRTDPHLLYYLFLNELRFLYISDFANTGVVKKFKEYPNINGMGESDISEDGDHFVLFSGREVLVYEISQDRKITSFTAPWDFNNLYITPDNNVLLTATEGVYFRNSVLRKIANRPGHMDVCRDANGDEICVWTNSGDPQPLNGCWPNLPSSSVMTLVTAIAAPVEAGTIFTPAARPSLKSLAFGLSTIFCEAV